jgi:acetyltransferase
MESARLTLPELTPDTVAQLTPLFPEEASIRNPLDMIASATAPAYTKALAAVLADPQVDAAVPIFVPPFGIRQEDVAEAIIAAARTETTKPILTVLMGRDGLAESRTELLDAGIPTYVFPESAARALAALNEHVEWASRPMRAPEPLPVDRDRVRRIIDGAYAAGRSRLDELEALDVLEAYGVPVARAQIVTDDSLAAAAAGLRYPVVMKVVSPDVEHKTDAGGVAVGIASAADLVAAHGAMRARLAERAPNARITGFLVQEMVSGGRETIVGISHEPGFGPLVMFGLGGVLVEALRDVVFRLAPVDAVEAREMIGAIRGARMFGPLRGDPPVDRDALADAVRRIAQLAADFPEIAEADANPLLARPDGAIALDARIRLTPRTAEK